MRRITFQLILPLAIISMFVVTKWWFVLPVDAPDQVMHGFPLIFMGPGFHTSMSLQFFMGEFLIDFLVYFLLWWILIFEIRRLYYFDVKRYIAIILWWITGILLSFFIVNLNISHPLFYTKRPFDIEVLDSGIQFNWEKKERPDITDYR